MGNYPETVQGVLQSWLDLELSIDHLGFTLIGDDKFAVVPMHNAEDAYPFHHMHWPINVLDQVENWCYVNNIEIKFSRVLFIHNLMKQAVPVDGHLMNQDEEDAYVSNHQSKEDK